MFGMANTAMYVSKLCIVLYCIFRRAIADTGPCQLENDKSNIIVDIEESRGLSISQSTIPSELPIIGEPNVDIFLDLIFPKGNPIFALNGKKLQLISPLDRDADNLSHIVFQLSCTVKSTRKKRTIPVIVRLTDVNDNAPEFINTPYETSISELTPIGTTIFQNVLAKDKDIGVNGLVEYSIVEGIRSGIGYEQGIGKARINSADGYGYFAINLPHQGQITVNRTLDYEKMQRYYVTIVASDRAQNTEERLSATTTLIVNINDDDDQNPAFIYKGCMLLDGYCINPEYSAVLSSGTNQGALNILPEKIQAIDMDTLNTPILYSFVSGYPTSYSEYFNIDPISGIVNQIKSIDTSSTKSFNIIIKAQEKSEAKRSTTAKLNITIKPVDANPPEIFVSSSEGYVDENAPIGTVVVDTQGIPLTFTVNDKDYEPHDEKPDYNFELTSPSFFIDKNNHLVVNENNLDRDPPNPGKFRFQIVAREQGGKAASPPLPITVYLNDVNDSPPVLPQIPPIKVAAGEGKRAITTIQATDNDIGENAQIEYSIYHVSSDGNNKFAINRKTGVLETNSKLNAGEQYSLTIKAADKGGLHSQVIVEINVTKGPNTKSPVFEQAEYNVEVSEGATINSTITAVTAEDPEHDPVTYSIISGNDLRQFTIAPTTGIITLIRKLDREDLTRYLLVIKAEDSGKLSSTVNVNIRITDVNDKNPEFIGDPYSFSVKEGEAMTTVGFVHAVDADEGINAVVSYSIPSDLPFRIDNETGEITTTASLDYEEHPSYQFVVTAKDSATDARIATATVTISVIDTEDELPIFQRLVYEASVPENIPEHFVTDVMAHDPDTVKKIKYVIQQGPTDLFKIDENTGAIYTARGLDYEKESEHVLIIGTLENMSNGKSSTTKVLVHVEDRNDIPPVFTIIPHPITLDDDVSVGTSVTNLIATDSDGTAPGNKVRYEVIGRGKSPNYFQIEPDSGILKVINDFRKEIDTEYQIDVRAYDLGEPQLSSVITVEVYIQHVATVAPEVGLRFADNAYSVQIPENATIDRLIKTLTIVNSRLHGPNIPLKCHITSGNKEGKFKVNITEERSCALYLNSSLDYETEESYQLEVQLISLQGFINRDFSTTQVSINVADVNDNKPFFIYPTNSVNNGKYYAAISSNAPIATNVIQIKADDKDSGKYGKVIYGISGNYSNDYFTIDKTSGIVKTMKSFHHLYVEPSPFNLVLKIRDNPNATTEFNEIQTPLIVNLIHDSNRMVLVIGDAKPDLVSTKLETLTHIMQEQTDLIVGVEKLTTREYIGENGTLEVDPEATDIWFYLVDPETDAILPSNHSIVRRAIFEKSAMDNITFDVSGQIKHTAFNIHEPIMLPTPKSATVLAFNGEVFPYALIVIACIIFVFGVIGIIYICASWSRYKSSKEQMHRSYAAPASPMRYDTYVEPNLKEYETQVLQMCVPVDDHDEFNDLHLDFSNKNHAFNLDNVSYISKDNNIKRYGGQRSPVSSESATTARASSIGESSNKHRGHIGKDHNIYQRSSDEEDLSESPTNDNVTFRGKKDYSHLGYSYNERSPIETTTEL